jgi:hypothetical protein
MRSASSVLPIGKVIAGSLVLSWEKRHVLLRALWLPLLLGIALTVAESLWGPGPGEPGVSETSASQQSSLLLWTLPLFALTVVFAVRSYRVYLLGDLSPDRVAPISWGLRETRFIFAMAGIAFVFLMAAFVFGSAVGLVVPRVNEITDTRFGLALILPPAYLAGRLLLALPAIAVDHYEDVFQALAASWKMTRHNGLKVLVLCVLVPGALAWSLEEISLIPVPGIYLLSAITVSLVMPMEVALVALSYLTLRRDDTETASDTDQTQ